MRVKTTVEDFGTESLFSLFANSGLSVCSSKTWYNYILIWAQMSRVSAHFTWSKEVSDQWNFSKHTFCHKKPKVLME